MATSTVTPVDTGALSTEKVSYRAGIKTSTDATGKTVVDKIQAKAASAKLGKRGGPENWEKMEDEGFTTISENEFTRYTVKSLDGFTHLVPNEAQQLYILNAGLGYIQNAKSNSMMVELVDNAPEPTPVHANETIDLREAINEEPTRKMLSNEEKLQKLIAGLGLAPDQIAALLLSAAQTLGGDEEVEA